MKTADRRGESTGVLGAPTGPSRRLGILDRTFVEVPLAVHWLDPLPVAGSEWWVNIYLPGGGHLAHKLDPGEPGRANKTLVLIDRSKLAAWAWPTIRRSRSP